MTAKRISGLLREMAVARVPDDMENKRRGLRRWLHRLLKRWWTGLDARTRGELRVKLERRLPLKRRYFVGAPQQLARFGMSVDRPMPWSRRRMLEAEAKKARRQAKKRKTTG